MLKTSAIHRRVNPSGYASSWRQWLRTSVNTLVVLACCAFLPASAAIDLGALPDDPCLIVPQSVIAQVFEVPEDQIRQTGVKVMGRLACKSKWSGDSEGLRADVTTQIFDNPIQAKQHFASTTQSASAEEVATTMEAIKDKDAKPGSPEDMANKLLGKLLGGAIEFEDVDGVGDEARFDVGDAALTVRQGNLVMKVEAYHGPNMPMPEKMDSQSIMKAAKQWQEDTRTERKKDASALAAAIVRNLQ